MAIKGSLQEATLPDVVQLLHLGRRTGRLALADRGRHASLFFEDGWIVHAEIVNRSDRLGDLLVGSGLVTADMLARALELQRRGDRRLGDVLVELGAVSRADVEGCAHRQVEEAVYSLFRWRGGSFSFEPGVRPDDSVEPVRISPDALLLEGARRVDEWSVIEQKIPSFDLIFDLDRTRARLDDEGFTEVQRRLLELLDGTRDVRTLVDESRLNDFDACQALFGLVSAGVIHRVGTSSPGPSVRSRESRIEEHRNLGVAFYRTGMLDEAIREFRRVTELRPGEGTAPFFLGLGAARQGRWADAVYFFRQAQERAGPRAAVIHNLAVALAETGDEDQAEQLLSDAAGRTASDPRIQLTWGLVALEREDVAAACARLGRAGELFGESPPAIWYWAAARAFAAAGDGEKALEIATTGAAAYPGHAVLLNNRAVLLEAGGDMVEAEAVLNQALEADPALPEVSKNLGDVLYRLGRFDEATAAYERAARLNPDLGDDLYFKLGNLAVRRGERTVAREQWSRAVALNPGHQLARANLEALGSAG